LNFDQRGIARLILLLQIVEKASAQRHHLEKTTTGMVVLDVTLEVLGQIFDTLGENGHLDFRRTSVALARGEFLQKSLLTLCSDRHRVFPFNLEETGRPRPGCRPAGAMKCPANRRAGAHIG
jgi:hypothetical protein